MPPNRSAFLHAADALMLLCDRGAYFMLYRPNKKPTTHRII